jgi:hypothetical protein
MAAVYKGSLTLNKVTGIRVDKNQKPTMVKLKEDPTKRPPTKKSMKSTPNTLRGTKY